jgi:epoxyqueuosine reductase
VLCESSLKKMLYRAGATVVGVAELEGHVEGEISHLKRAVSIGVDQKLREDTLAHLNRLQKKVVRYLKGKGFRTLSIPPDSDRIRDKFVAKLYPLLTHKMAATCAGIGWIGRNGLLISPHFGPRLSLATVLTDAPLRGDVPYERSRCGNCRLCVDYCPSQAITGKSWTRSDPYNGLVKPHRCRAHKKSARGVTDRPNCGLCLQICPYGRTQRRMKPEYQMEIV